MSTLEETEEGIVLLEKRIASNCKEISVRREENRHLLFTVKLLKRKQRKLVRGKHV